MNHLLAVICQISVIHKETETDFSGCHGSHCFLLTSHSCDQRPLLTSGNNSRCLQSLFSPQSGIIKPCTDNIRNSSVFIRILKELAHPCTGKLSAPPDDSGIVKADLTGSAHQGSVIQIRLQSFHNSIIQEQSFCIVRRTHQKFNGSGFLFFLHFFQVFLFNDLFCDHLSCLTASEGRIIFHRIGIHNKIIIGKYRDLCLFYFCQHIRQSISVYRSDNKSSYLLFQHFLYLRYLPGRVSLSIGQ